MACGDRHIHPTTTLWRFKSFDRDVDAHNGNKVYERAMNISGWRPGNGWMKHQQQLRL